MRKSVLFVMLLLCFVHAYSQGTFRCGWETYKTGVLIHEYAYLFNLKDSSKLVLQDSTRIFVSADSLVSMSMYSVPRDKSVYKTCYYFNAKKLIVKSEEYRDDELQVAREWKYDDKNRKIFHLEDNKQTGNSFRKTYDYSVDKKKGETVVSESSYFNGKIEFYTKTYYSRDNVKLKEVRLNDNNKDIVHIESYTYGDNGKVKERSVFFPEWKVTKKFEEKEGNELPKCFKSLPVGTAEKVSLATRVPYIKKLIARNTSLFADKDCFDFEYKFSNYTTCDIVVTNTNVNGNKKVVFRYKEKY